MKGNILVDVPNELPGTIHPFPSKNGSTLSIISREVGTILKEKQGKKIAWFIVLNLLVTVLLLIWCSTSNSMGLTAYTYLTIFDTFRLLTCLVSVWVQKQKTSTVYPFGHERFEVLAVFSSTMLSILGSFFIVKESVERMIIQPDVHVGRLLLGTSLAFVTHIGITYSIDNKAFNHVTLSSSSSWLQEHVTDISESLCQVVPGLSKLLLPRINPFALIAAAGGLALAIVYVLIDMRNYHSIDTWAAIWIALMTMGTMVPMSVYSGKILLQTTPSHLIGQLDKCLREASTLDGVLEFRNEHFWTLSFGKMAGSVHVRVRRDADEQMVLAHVYHRLTNLINILTVQIFKDDWSRPSALQILGDQSLMGQLNVPNTGNSIKEDTTNSQKLYNSLSSEHRTDIFMQKPTIDQCSSKPSVSQPKNTILDGQSSVPYSYVDNFSVNVTDCNNGRFSSSKHQ